MEPLQKMNFQLYCRLVYTDVLYAAHLPGNLLGLTILLVWELRQGPDSALWISVSIGIRDLPLSCLSISAKLLLLLNLLLTLGMTSYPGVSDKGLACTCPATRSSPKGRRELCASWLHHCLLGVESEHRLTSMPSSGWSLLYLLHDGSNLLLREQLSADGWCWVMLFECYSPELAQPF